MSLPDITALLKRATHAQRGQDARAPSEGAGAGAADRGTRRTVSTANAPSTRPRREATVIQATMLSKAEVKDVTSKFQCVHPITTPVLSPGV